MSYPFEEIIAFCKRRGLVFSTSSIYGGLANCYDYGPLGVELLKNLKNLWWTEFIYQPEQMYSLDSQIILHPQTWISSGHVDSFTDPLVEDKITHERFRADHLIEHYCQKKKLPVDTTKMSINEMTQFIDKNQIKSPHGNLLTQPKNFNILFESSIGVIAGEKNTVYLRGETAQGIFTNFKNIINTYRVKLPFGVGGIGKSFRNEITTGQFVFRTLEFEQAEIEYFFNPQKSEWLKLFKEWQNRIWHFLTQTLKLQEANLRWREHSDKERSHYSLATSDLEYQYSFGFKEVWGLAYRTNYDLKKHQKFCHEDLSFHDSQSDEKFLPHVIEPALGINRLFLAILSDCLWFDGDKKRLVLKLPVHLAPIKIAVFPLLKNKPDLINKAKQIYQQLKSKYHQVTFDDRGNIGKRYLYQDEIGTPFCLTIDFETLEKNTLTVRERDSANQQRISIDKLISYFDDKILTNNNI